MKRKSIKKALTALMAATLIFTSSGFESIASAAEVKVQAVYTTFSKAALTVGETKQIKTYTEPENASNKEMEFSSSNENVATVSDTGLVTAVAPGTANIKVKATDGSKEYETVKITVVKSVTIDKKSVDSDNDVILLDKSYADLTIKKSVGNANIYLSKVNVKGKLTLEDGNYTVYVYDSSLNNVVVDKAQTSGKVASMALDTKGLEAPMLCLNDYTKVNEMNAYINSSIKFTQDSSTDKFNVIQKYNDLLEAVISGYTGALNVAAAGGQVNTKFLDSTLTSATVSGGTGSSVAFDTEDKSKVGQLTVSKQVKLALDVPADNLLVDTSATGGVTVSSPVGTLTNNAPGAPLVIDSSVGSLLSTGANAKITIGSKGTVTAATLSGAGSSVDGSGLLKALDIKANNCVVNTVGTAVKLGNVTGTMVQGQPMSAGETATTIVLPVGGGGGTSTTKPTVAPTATATPTPTTGAVTTPTPAPVKLDLSTFNTDSGATYDAATGITAKNIAMFNIALPTTLSANDTLYIRVSGSYTGTTGFRSWLTDGSGGALSNIQLVATSATPNIPLNSGESFTITYPLKVNAGTSGVTKLLFKASSYDAKLENIIISSVYVSTHDPKVTLPSDPTPTPEATPTPTPKFKIGEVILDNDFEDGTNKLASIQGSLTMETVDGGNGSNKALKVSGKTATWNGVGFDLGTYLNEKLTIKVKADIKCDVAGPLLASIAVKSSDGDGWPKLQKDGKDLSIEGEAGKWYTLEGTFVIDSKYTSAKLYFEAPGADGGYYLDNVKITVAAVGDAVPVKGITLDKSTLDLDTGASGTLVATIDPANADNKEVTWESSDTAVATVTNGTVKAVSAGKATITATTKEGSFKATCTVNVSNNVMLALDYGTVILSSIGATQAVKVNSNNNVVWSSLDTSVATVKDGTITAVKNGTTKVTATVGTKSVSCDVVVNDQITFYEDFETGKSNLPTAGDWALTATVMNDGKAYNGSYYLKAETLKYAYNGFVVTLDNSTGTKDAIFNITSFVKAGVADMGIEYFYDDKADGYGISKITATPGAWSKFQSANIKVAAGTSKKIRLFSTDASITFYVDSVYITKTFDTADYPITGVTLNKSAVTLMKGTTEQLTANVLPANCTTDKTVTWSTSDPTVALVDKSTGMVTAVASGSAIITATTTVSGVSDKAFTATCTVKVSSAQVVTGSAIVYDFESGAETISTVGAAAKVVPMSEMQTNVKAEFGSSNALKVVTSNYNGLPKFKLTLPAGKKLSDYTKITVRYYTQDTKAQYKQAYVLAADNQITYTGWDIGKAPEIVGSITSYSAFSKIGKWDIQEITIDPVKAAAVSGSSIELAIGINAPGATYYIDDVTLVGTDNLVIMDFETPIVAGTAGGATVTASVVTADQIAADILTNKSSKVLQVTNSGWGQAAKIKVTLAPGTSISDYDNITFKVYLPSITTDGGEQKFDYKDFYISLGLNITNPADVAVLAKNWPTAGNQGTWVEVSATISSDIKASIGTATTFEIALGCNTPSTTSYYIDDITLVPVK